MSIIREIQKRRQLDEISSDKLHDYADHADSSYYRAKKAGDKKTMEKRARGEKSLKKRSSTCDDCGGSGKDHAGHNFAHTGGHNDCENCSGRGHIFHGNEEAEPAKSVIREEIEALLAEGAVKAANKVKKNLHALKIGHSKSTEALIDKTNTGRHGELTGAVLHSIKRDQSGQSRRHYDQQTAARFKRDGRKHMRGEFLHQKDGK